VESDVQNAFLDLRAATSRVEVARRNLQVTKETLQLTRQRFDAGVTDNVEVVQAQESLTFAELDVISSVFADNVAKLSLARSIASAADSLQQFLRACLRSSEQQSEEGQVDHLHAGIEFAFAVFP
jgi:outer membrane protein TolC